MPFRLHPLPYDAAALEPHFDPEWVESHRRWHHGYADRLNSLLSETEWAQVPVASLLRRLHELPEELREPVRENAGGHLNHTLLFAGIGPDGGGEPGYEFLDDIERDFGSFPAFQQAAANACAELPGDGWVWLVWNGKQLELVATELEHSPIDRHHEPLLGIDLWQHAYERLFGDRAAYVQAYWHVVDWRVIGERFLEAEEVSRGGPGV
jgi:Fe-Mn family superoxide dismutase